MSDIITPTNMDTSGFDKSAFKCPNYNKFWISDITCNSSSI